MSISSPVVQVVARAQRGSETSAQFSSEITIHYSGIKNIDNPGVMLFPKVAVCPPCGLAEFAVPEAELRLLRQEHAGSTAA